MRALSTAEVNDVSGGGLGLLAGIGLVIPPLLKISIGAGLGLSSSRDSGHGSGNSHCEPRHGRHC